MKQYDFMRGEGSNGENDVVLDRVSKKKLDIIPRLLCLLIAFFIWVYMVNLNDTDVSTVMTLKIDVVGEEALAATGGMAIYGVDKRTVTVTVKGSNRDLKKYSEADYMATLDVSKLSSSGEHSVAVNIVTPEGSSIELVSCEPSNVTVFSDISISKEIPLKVDYGDVIMYSAEYNLSQTADKIEITGPKAIIENIDHAYYEVKGDLDSSTSYSGFAIALHDDKDVEIPLENYEYINYSTKDITVNLDVILRLSAVPIRVKVIGMGSDLIATLDREYVSVYGDRLLIKQLVDITYIIELDEAEVGTIKYTLSDDDLPEGVFVDDGTVTITFSTLDIQADET